LGRERKVIGAFGKETKRTKRKMGVEVKRRYERFILLIIVIEFIWKENSKRLC
jgi:hypothetical protein